MSDAVVYEPLSRKEKQSIASVAKLLLCLVVGGFLLFYVLDYRMRGAHYLAFSSPDGSKSAYLVTTSGLGMAVPQELFVSLTGSMEDMRWIGTVGFDDGIRLAELVWSKNSNVVAAACNIEGFSTGYTHGYIFSSGTSLIAGDMAGNYFTKEELQAQDREIRRILAEKGGAVVVATEWSTPTDPNVKDTPLGWRQLRKCRVIIEEGKAKRRKDAEELRIRKMEAGIS